jgi:hypothetical protein
MVEFARLQSWKPIDSALRTRRTALHNGCTVTDRADKIKLVQDVPEPPAFTEDVRRRLAAEADQWHEAFSPKVAAIEAVTPEDLRVRVR